MMRHDGICQLMCPEIEDRDIEDAADWHLPVDPIRWGLLHILEQHRAKFRLMAVTVLFWPGVVT